MNDYVNVSLFVDADGRLTDPTFFVALDGSVFQDRALRMLRPVSPGVRDLEWTPAFALSSAPWDQLPPVVLDLVCDYLCARDVVAMSASCGAWRRTLKKNTALATICDLWVDARQCHDQRLAAKEENLREEERRRRREQRVDKFCLLLPFVASPLTLVAESSPAIVGLVWFALLREGLSVFPTCPQEGRLYALLFSMCALFLVNTVLLFLAVRDLWVSQSQSRRRPIRNVDWVNWTNAAGVCVNLTAIVVGAVAISDCLACSVNPTLTGQAYSFLCVMVAFASLQFLMGMLLLLFSYGSPVQRLYRSIRHRPP